MALPKQKICKECNGSMILEEKVYALIVVEKKSDGTVVFQPASGIPVKVYVCRRCGYIELYSAILTQEF